MDCCDDFKEIIGLKAYFGSSQGNLLIGKTEEQRMLYDTLEQGGFKGVLAGHFEDEDMIQSLKYVWMPKFPQSHCAARPKEAEIKSVGDHILLAKESGFKGTMHVCHATCPETVDLVDAARKEMKIACEVTPHHLLWTFEMMLAQPAGLIFKMNPPLRARADVVGLHARVLAGKVDCIGTDHAPHALEEKLYPPYASGYPSLNEYQNTLELLRAEGASEYLIDEMTHDNIVEEFGNRAATA
jgi:dihydroorotase